MNQFFPIPKLMTTTDCLSLCPATMPGLTESSACGAQATAAGRNPDKWFGNIDKHSLACGLLHQQERGHLRALGESRPDEG